MKKLLYITIFTLFSLVSFSQTIKISGKIADKTDKLPLPGANIVVIDSLDTDNLKGTTSDKEGVFAMNTKKGTYKVRISFLGYTSFEKIIHVNKKSIDLGDIFLKEDREMLNEIKIVEEVPPTIQKGDTTQFNAIAFKTNPDASAKEMVLKMPGFMMVDGKIMFQGEEIKQVLIDGREFFGKDAMEALVNIPVDIIKSIKVYEYQSDQARFTGFKDFTQAKTVDIITKNGFHNLVFGEVGVSGGTNNQYSANGSVNIFSGEQRMSVTSRASKYESDDDRIKRENKGLGLYYNNKVSEKSEIGVNYSYSDNSNKSSSEIDRTYISSELKGQNLLQNSLSKNKGDNHNFNLRWNYKINEFNSFIYSPSGSLSNSESNSTSSSKTFEKEVLINSSNNSNNNDSKNFNLSHNLTYFHKFKKMGRTLSLNVSNNTGDNDSDGNQYSETGLEDDDTKKTINQIINNSNDTKSFSTDLTFTERLGKNFMARLSYRGSYNNNHSDKKAYNIDEFGNISEETDLLTSKDYRSTRKNHRVISGLQYRTEKLTVSINAEYGQLTQESNEKYPEIKNESTKFNAFNPSFRFRYSAKRGKNISFNYRSNVSNPSFSQLQDVLDNTNPLFLRTGNPDLDQSRSHNFDIRLSNTNMKTGSYFSLSANVGFSNNYIGQETVYAKNDTTIYGNIELARGGQFSRPVNMSGSLRARTNITYGIPVKIIKSRLNLSTSVSFRKSPNQINGIKSYSRNYQISQGVSLASNISEKLDFNLSTSSYLSFLENSGTSTKTKRLTQSSNLRFFWNPFGKIIMRTNLSNTINDDLKGDYYQINWNWDMTIGTKLFKKRQGEISFTAKDILNNKDSYSHIVSDLYIQDSRSSVMNRYYMVRFSYRFR